MFSTFLCFRLSSVFHLLLVGTTLPAAIHVDALRKVLPKLLARLKVIADYDSHVGNDTD